MANQHLIVYDDLLADCSYDSFAHRMIILLEQFAGDQMMMMIMRDGVECGERRITECDAENISTRLKTLAKTKNKKIANTYQ